MHSERFEQLLQRYLDATPAQRGSVEAELWSTFGRRCAVFVSDLSGFTRRSQEVSIVHFLGLIRRCRQLLRPIITAHGGAPIKTAADNIYATFPTARDAVEASLEMQSCLDQHNKGCSEGEQISLCIGIGFGEVLLIGEEDFFGEELNLAFKLGEDTADAGEILVTRAVLQELGEAAFPHDPRSIALSGVTIEHAAIRR